MPTARSRLRPTTVRRSTPSCWCRSTSRSRRTPASTSMSPTSCRWTTWTGSARSRAMQRSMPWPQIIFAIIRDRKSTRLNSGHTVIYTLSLHDALPIFDVTYQLPLDDMDWFGKIPGDATIHALATNYLRNYTRSEERRVGKECRSRCDWSSDVCSSDLRCHLPAAAGRHGLVRQDPGRCNDPCPGHKLSSQLYEGRRQSGSRSGGRECRHWHSELGLP